MGKVSLTWRLSAITFGALTVNSTSFWKTAVTSFGTEAALFDIPNFKATPARIVKTLQSSEERDSCPRLVKNDAKGEIDNCVVLVFLETGISIPAPACADKMVLC